MTLLELRQRIVLAWGEFNLRNFLEKVWVYILLKISYIILLGISILSILFIWWVRQHTRADVVTIWEKRLYVWATLLLLATITFGVLRMYNAIVANTRFLVLLKNEMKLFRTNLTNLTVNFRDLRATIRTLVSTLNKKKK